MKESIRCCISCILPCGALDVIRIVHASGRVEEISSSVCARDIMRAYPKHVLRKPPSFSFDDDVTSTDHTTTNNTPRDRARALVLPPNAELQRGKIYFLIPLNSTNSNSLSSSTTTTSTDKSPARRRRKKRPEHHSSGNLNNVNRRESNNVNTSSTTSSEEDRTRFLLSDRYLSEILLENKSRDHPRRGRAGVWRPHLESIEEISNDV